MKNIRRAYYNDKWFEFPNLVKKRDNFKCLKCCRGEKETTLQTHHKIYKPGFQPWEYSLSDCLTLCKGCYALEHGLIEPKTGWILITIDDLGGIFGICERKGCGHGIRYENITYHSKWGYKTVGSTCVEHLTQEDQFLSKDVIKIFKNISDFLNISVWENGITRKGGDYKFTEHAYHIIRIYGKENSYSFQIALKQKGEKWYDFKNIISTKNKNLIQVKELGYIVLKGLITEDKRELDFLRNIYRRIK